MMCITHEDKESVWGKLDYSIIRKVQKAGLNNGDTFEEVKTKLNVSLNETTETIDELALNELAHLLTTPKQMDPELNKMRMWQQANTELGVLTSTAYYSSFNDLQRSNIKDAISKIPVFGKRGLSMKAVTDALNDERKKRVENERKRTNIEMLTDVFTNTDKPHPIFIFRNARAREQFTADVKKLVDKLNSVL
jgi:hypothetical protein